MKSSRIAFVAVLLALPLSAQQKSGGIESITGAVNNLSGGTTRVVQTGTAAPGTCATGQFFWDTDASAPNQFLQCTATNTWRSVATLAGDGQCATVNFAVYPAEVTLDYTCLAKMSDLQTMGPVKGVSAAGADSYAITLAPAITSLSDGTVYWWRADAANVATACLNVNALGCKQILRYNYAALADGDICLGWHGAQYRASSDNLRLITPLCNAPGGGGATITSTAFTPWGFYPTNTPVAVFSTGVSNHIGNRFIVPFTVAVTTLRLHLSVGLASTAKGLIGGLYSSDCNTKLGQTAVHNTTATGTTNLTFSPAVTLTPGEYWFTFASDDTAVQPLVPQPNATFYATFNGGDWGKSSQAATGTGASITLPSTCGTWTQDSNVVGVWFAARP